MEIKDLINVFNEVLNPDAKEVIHAETAFKDCERWDSMSAFEITEKLHTQYGIKLRGIQVRKCTTIQELYNTLD